MKRVFNFDEWLPWEQNAAPMLLVMTLNAGMKNLREYFGMGLWTSVILFEENQAKWLFRPKELKLLGQKMIDFLMCPAFRVAFFTGYDAAEETLLEQARELQCAGDLSLTADQGLVNRFQRLSETYYAWYKYGWFCEPVQFQAQDLINGFLEKEIKEGRLKIEAAEARQALFALEEESFAVAILDDLRGCAEALEQVLKDPGVSAGVRELRGKPDFAESATGLVMATIRSGGANEPTRRLWERLQHHTDRFYWKRNNYASTQYLSERDVLTEILSGGEFDVAQPAASLDRELAKVREGRTRLLAKKAELVAILPPYLRNIVALVGSVGGGLLDRRKRAIMIVNSAFDRILGELARRKGVPHSDVRLLTPQELGEFIERPAGYSERFGERRKVFLVVQGDVPLIDEIVSEVVGQANGELRFEQLWMREPFIAEGEQAERVLRQLNERLNFLREETGGGLGHIQGVPVYFEGSESVIEGTVRVVRDPKQGTLRIGEILVAPSTTPDYMDAIRRCKAIVTDWGGQTSHAAITARELRKPCIIGTNYASQVLKDGDRVRLDLRSGMVEVLKEG